jgi:CRISPR-associated endonuclease/helicase Cas3
MTFRDWFTFEPNVLQQSLLDGLPACARPGAPGLLIIMSDTGSGKTEAGLWSARWLGGPRVGVHLALPTMATTDSAHRRVARWAKQALAASSPVTLAHGQAGWNRAPSRFLAHADEIDTSAPAWLHGFGRAVLAGVTVSTIDQVLMAVLRVRHNVLRLGGLTRKVLVVDECHAYDPYMQTQLRRALAWWGALRVPVVLMSATLPAAVATSLAAAYLSGSAPDAAQSGPVSPVYPGWFYVDGETGAATVSPQLRTDRARTIDIAMTDLPGSPRQEKAPKRGELGEVPAADRARAEFVGNLMDANPGSFTVLTVCNTVASAQHTARALADRLGVDVEIFLIHARYRAGDRKVRTDAVEAAFGKNPKKRVTRAVLVTTQVCEVALDLSLDHLVTDLAPLPQIIQRAGRVLRHVTEPDVLVPVTVLVPRDEETGAVDDARWPRIYSPALIRATRELLDAHGPIAVPGDVQMLVDKVCAGWDRDTADEDVAAHLRGEQAMANAAVPVIIPHPTDCHDLFDLTNLPISDAEAATRYNLDSVAVLPVWQQADGALTLEPGKDSLGMPERLPADLRPIRDQLLSVRRAGWQTALGPAGEVPVSWSKDGRLGQVLLLVHSAPSQRLQLAGWTVFYDEHLGLVTWPPVARGSR